MVNKNRKNKIENFNLSAARGILKVEKDGHSQQANWKCGGQIEDDEKIHEYIEARWSMFALKKIPRKISENQC